MRCAGGRPRGFTLIEVIIVVAVIGVVAMSAAPAVNAFTGANARSAAGEIAGAYRYLFDTAALRHQTCRMVLDLDAREWWAECTGPGQPGQRSQPVMDRKGEVEDDDRLLAQRFSDEPSADKRRFLARARFTEFGDRQVQRRQLHGSAAFEKVWTPRNREPQSKGKAYVYFFPQGQADLVHIPVADGSNVYTVVTQPMTGRARVLSGIPEAPR